MVSQEQVDQARKKDREDVAKLQEAVQKLAFEIASMPQQVTGAQVGPIRERIDEMLHRAAAIGGGPRMRSPP